MVGHRALALVVVIVSVSLCFSSPQLSDVLGAAQDAASPAASPAPGAMLVTPVAGTPVPVASPVEAATGTYFDTVRGTSGLVAYWRLDEPSGATATDSSGNGRGGIYGPGVALGVPSAVGSDGNRAISFDGTRDAYVDIGDVLDFGGREPFSLEAWISPSDSPGVYPRILQKEGQDEQGRRQGYVVFVDEGTGRLGFERWRDNKRDASVSPSAIPMSAWTHVVATYDGTSIRLFVNGVPVASSTASLEILDTPFPLRIGNSSSGGDPFRGIIDEVAVYRIALDEPTVTAHYAIGTGGSIAITATPEPMATPSRVATPIAAATPIPTATATPGPAATPTAATPTPRPSPTAAEGAPLVEFVDARRAFAVGYPSDWRRLTEDEIRAQLGIEDERAAEAALANTAFVAVSPDGRAVVALTQLPFPGPEEASLDAIVAALREANAASVAGIGDVREELIMLGGADAVRLGYTADDPATGAAGGRLIRQVITTTDDGGIVLTFIVRAEDAPAFEDSFRRIEKSWRWQP